MLLFKRSGINLDPALTPLGIQGGAMIEATFAPSTTPDLANNALWFQTRNVAAKNWGPNYPLWYYDAATPDTSRTFGSSSGTLQPLLVPVLQIHAGQRNNTER